MRFIYDMGAIMPADPEAASFLVQMPEGTELEVKVVKSQRTAKQNRALWRYCEMLAEALNLAGFDMRSYPFREGLEIPFTKTSVMEQFWRPVQIHSTGKKSTSQLETKEVNQIYEALDKAMSERVGVRVEFPSNT